MTITTRAGKGSELTWNEIDGNFDDLNTRTALGWRDNIIELKVDASSPYAPTLDPFRGSILAWNFPAGETTEAHAAWHIDHDYAPDTKLYFHVHWSPTTASAGTVRWGFEFTIAKGHQQQAFPATQTVYVEQASISTAYMHYVAEVSEANAIDGAVYGIEPDTVIMVRMFRDGAHANDTFPDAAYGLFLDLHYQASQATTPNKFPPFV